MDTESQRDSGLGVAERHPSDAIGAHAQVWTAAFDWESRCPRTPGSGHDIAVADDDFLMRSRRAWPWGLVLISDSESQESLPDRNEGLVVAAHSALAARILHEVDGKATAEVWVSRRPQGLHLVYDGDIDIPSGTIQISDAAGDAIESATVEPGSYSVQVYVDDDAHPERVIVALNQPG